jgi:hypothetical protein
MSPLITVPVPAAAYVQASGTYTLSGAGVINTSNPYSFNFKHGADRRLQLHRAPGEPGRHGRVGPGRHGRRRGGRFAGLCLDGALCVHRRDPAAINGNNKSRWRLLQLHAAGLGAGAAARQCAVFRGLHDGVNWTEKTNVNVSAATLYVGLALSSGSNSALVTADFDNVSIVGGGR